MATAPSTAPQAGNSQINMKQWRKLELLRREQKEQVQKLNIIENDLAETNLVLEALKDVDPKRRAYRTQSGFMTETTVEAVVPNLQTNKKQLEYMIDAVRKQVSEKGAEIQKFIADNKISFAKPPQ